MYNTFLCLHLTKPDACFSNEADRMRDREKFESIKVKLENAAAAAAAAKNCRGGTGKW